MQGRRESDPGSFSPTPSPVGKLASARIGGKVTIMKLSARVGVGPRQSEEPSSPSNDLSEERQRCKWKYHRNPVCLHNYRILVDYKDSKGTMG